MHLALRLRHPSAGCQDSGPGGEVLHGPANCHGPTASGHDRHGQPQHARGTGTGADAWREYLVRDIFDGTLSADFDVPVSIRAALRRQIGRPDPERAHDLENLIRRSGTLYPKEFWSGLSLLATWLGGSCGVYLPLLKKYYGDTAFRDHGLSASEGRMTIPLADGASSGVLEFSSHYFEFVPEEEHGGAQPTVLEAHELEAGRNYFILLTTSGGLYRYDIHDVVRCVGYEGEAPLLEFLNKGAHFSSITGEKLSEFQVVEATRKSFAELGLPLEHFTAGARDARAAVLCPLGRSGRLRRRSPKVGRAGPLPLNAIELRICREGEDRPAFAVSGPEACSGNLAGFPSAADRRPGNPGGIQASLPGGRLAVRRQTGENGILLQVS